MDLINRFNELIINDQKINVLKHSDKIIGELSEKTLHNVIKNLYEDNQDFQEIKIDKYYVDILRDNNIIEIQTKQFNKLRDKISYLLSLNKYSINIVYPVFSKKTIYFIDSLDCKPKTSPKKFKIPEVFHELYMIKTLLNNENLQITLLVLEIDEYRKTSNNRKKYICYDRVPRKLIKEVILKSKDDYLKLLPLNLNEKFTSKELSQMTKTNVKYVNKMLNVLKYLNVVEVVGKEGRKLLYSVKRG